MASHESGGQGVEKDPALIAGPSAAQLVWGFLIVPPDVQEGVLAARRAVGAPPTLDQATLADFASEGHFERHLRRMRTAYRERLEALGDAIERYCGGVLKLQQTRTGSTRWQS